MNGLFFSVGRHAVRRSLGGLALGLGLIGAAAPASAQDTPKEVRAAAVSALSRGAFEEAIPALRQLIEWFGSSDKASTRAEMEEIYYSLGLCHLFLGQFGECRQAFETYLQRYPQTVRGPLVTIFIADTLRYESKLKDAVDAYQAALAKYELVLDPDLRTDILCSIARCILAELAPPAPKKDDAAAAPGGEAPAGEPPAEGGEGEAAPKPPPEPTPAQKESQAEREQKVWERVTPILEEILRIAPDFGRRNWAAAMLTVSHLKRMDLDPVYQWMPLLLAPGSFASHSILLNMTALETGDGLFAEEQYRDALWIYRLVYPHDVLTANSQFQLERAQRRVRRLMRTPGLPRQLLRAQETVAELEAEVAALAEIPNYDPELFFRMARAYLETRRCREAAEVFYRLYKTGDAAERAEECLYLAFFAAAKFKPPELAYRNGAEYMEVYSGGEYYDTVSLSLGQLHAAVQNWPKVLSVLTTALQVHPKHEQIAECLFLLGYASFMEEQFADAVNHLERLNREFPGNDREAEATYWTGMAYLFDKNYESAQPDFDRVVQAFSDCPFVEDASFRSATCDFGLSQFYAAEEKLLKFLTDYPQSKLAGEAYLMLGDISGTDGRLDEAVQRFQEATRHDLNIELYNYASFQAGEMLRSLTNYTGIVEHFTEYIQRNRPESNLPLAGYWIGDAKWELGHPDEALAFYLGMVGKLGGSRKDLGIDLILETWVGRAKNAGTKTWAAAGQASLQEKAWADLRALYRKAIDDKNWVLELRIKRILFFDPTASDKEKETVRAALLDPKNLAYASAGVLEWILDEATRLGKTELARAAADTLIRDFAETDYALNARALLAKDAIQSRDYATAIKHLNVIREVYAATPEAADALMSLGAIYREQQNWDAADAAYKDLLGVKEWKERWPEALYRRGETAMARRQYEPAAAYFERIYVLYGAHRDWVAKAYLARAECLAKLSRNRDAVEVLTEMLDVAKNPLLAEHPDRAAAEKRLAELKGRS